MHETVTGSASGRPRMNPLSRGPASIIEVALGFQAPDIVQRLIEGFDGLAGDASGIVYLAEELQILVKLGALQLAADSRAEPALAHRQQVHVMLDEPERPFRHG